MELHCLCQLKIWSKSWFWHQGPGTRAYHKSKWKITIMISAKGSNLNGIQSNSFHWSAMISMPVIFNINFQLTFFFVHWKAVIILQPNSVFFLTSVQEETYGCVKSSEWYIAEAIRTSLLEKFCQLDFVFQSKQERGEREFLWNSFMQTRVTRKQPSCDWQLWLKEPAWQFVIF